MDKYKILSQIGNGKFGVVYHGIVIKTKEKVAIKLEKNTHMLKHESTVLHYLRDVDRVPTVYYYGRMDPYLCLVMTYYGDGSLGKLTVPEIYEWWKQAIRILFQVHLVGFIHRDIKPGHFLLAQQKWNLVDFGLASVYNPEPTERTQVTGSVHWCSYHVHCGHDASWRDDYISLLYVCIDCFLQTVDLRLPWLQYPGFFELSNPVNNLYKREKEWSFLTEFIAKSRLDETEKENITKLLTTAERLRYEDKPDYHFYDIPKQYKHLV